MKTTCSNIFQTTLQTPHLQNKPLQLLKQKATAQAEIITANRQSQIPTQHQKLIIPTKSHQKTITAIQSQIVATAPTNPQNTRKPNQQSQ